MQLRSDLIRGTLLGLIVLGIGGRLLMRVIAHMEGRIPAFTPEGSMTVVFAGTVAGAFAGLIYNLLRRFVRKPWVRTVAFVAICELVSWRGVHGLLPLPQAMFMTLALVYLAIMDILGRRSRHAPPNPADQAQPAF
jgi:hypothetical protein